MDGAAGFITQLMLCKKHHCILSVNPVIVRKVISDGKAYETIDFGTTTSDLHVPGYDYVIEDADGKTLRQLTTLFTRRRKLIHKTTLSPIQLSQWKLPYIMTLRI